MKKVFHSLLSAALMLISGTEASAVDPSLPLQEQLNLFADSLMRPGSFVVQGYMNPDCGHKLGFAVTGLLKNEGYNVMTDSAGRFNMTVPMQGPMQEMYLYRNSTITLPVYPGDTVNVDIEKKSVGLSGATPEATRDLHFASLVHDRFRGRILNFPRIMREIPQESLYKSCPDSLTRPLVDEAEAIISEWNQLQDSVEKAGGPLRSSKYYKYSGYVNPQVYLMHYKLYEYVNAEAAFMDRSLGDARPYSLIYSEDMVYPPVRDVLRMVVGGAASEANRKMSAVSFRDSDENLSVKSARLRRLIAKDEFLADWLDVGGFDAIAKYSDWERADGYLKYLKETVREPALQPYVDSIASELDKTRPGTPAPPLTLIGTDGKKYTLDDFRGKIVYLDFWNVGCGPCYQQFGLMPELKEFYKDYLDRIKFVTVICGDPDKETWMKLIEKFNLQHDLNTMLDIKESDSLYNLNSYPTYILIDPEGRLVKYGAERPSVLISYRKMGFTGSDLDKALGISDK